MTDPGDTPHPRALLSLIAGGLAASLLVRSTLGGWGTRPPDSLRLDPNTALPEVLAALPQLGPARVAAIVEARERGAIRSLDDLERRVRGIGPMTSAGLSPYLRFDSTPPPGR